MPVKIANMPKTPYQNSSIVFSPSFPASLENKDKSTIREIFAVQNSLSDFKKNQGKKPLPLTQLVIDSLVVVPLIESDSPCAKKHQYLMREASAYMKHVPVFEPLADFIGKSGLLRPLKTISFKKYPETASYIASVRAKNSELVKDITRDHKIENPSDVGNIEIIFADEKLIPNIGKNFSVTNAMSDSGIHSEKVRGRLENATVQIARYSIIDGVSCNDVVRKYGIRKDSIAAQLLKITAEEFAKNPNEYLRHPVLADNRGSAADIAG
ncbi:hypothetical protein [Erwinia amylovora]|uniref:hypothetical protein n=1 Tax=Erwinia amylovora TaxID=552 RepID=UPI00144495CA|nr:hypothetical protein [Erwinia amylovora]